MALQEQSGDERIVFKGKIFEIVQKDMVKGEKTVVFEIARRAPGVRLIIADKAKKQLLLSKEHRYELGRDDYRLPGGKVFDTLEELEAYRANASDMLVAAKQKALSEGIEEVGIDAKDAQLFRMSTLGATVEWDLYVFEMLDWQIGSQDLEVGEQIEAQMYSYDEVQKMILAGEMSEERVALILLQWLKGQ